MRDQYIQKWFSEVQEHSLYYNYRLYKTHFGFEKYLTILPEQTAKIFFKFRALNHKLPVQKGRIQGIERNEQLCQKCSLEELGDEYHYLFVCPSFSESRKLFLNAYYYKYPNTLKFQELFSTSRRKILTRLIQYIKIITKSM